MIYKNGLCNTPTKEKQKAFEKEKIL